MFACGVIKACTVLHNLALISDPIDVNRELERLDKRAPLGAVLNEYGLESEDSMEENEEGDEEDDDDDDEEMRNMTRGRRRLGADRVERVIRWFNDRMHYAE